MLKEIEPREAAQMLYRLPASPGVETVALTDAISRVCAREIAAAIPVPPFDRSPFDGYAFRGEDTRGASPERPAVLRITEEIPAGKVPEFEVTPGTAAKILTGAPIPKGANATVKYEETEFSGSEVRIFNDMQPDTDVIHAGEDIPPGRVIVRGGETITPPALAVLASQGIAEVAVYKKPLITIINTGTELCEIGNPLGPAMIYNSSVYMLGGFLGDVGANWINGGVAPDDAEIIAGRIAEALEQSDMVITTGGASVGDYDWALKSSEMTGASVMFWKTGMKPGGSLVASERGGKLILGLSGNPAAAALGLLTVAMPYVKKLCGYTDCFPELVDVTLREPYGKSGPRIRLLRGRLVMEGGTAYFSQMDAQGSGAFSSLVGCDLIGEIPANSQPLPAGSMIKAYRV